MKLPLIFIIITQIKLAAFAGAWIHVDQSNTGGPWDGSTNRPFQTITEGLDALALSNAVSQGGHTVLVADGVYEEGLVLNVHHSGLNGTPNQLVSGDRAVIHANTGISIQVLQDPRRWLDYFIIDGFNIEATTSNSGHGVSLGGGTGLDQTGVILRNCNIYGHGGTGINFSSQEGNMVIENCIIAGNGGYGVNEGHAIGRANSGLFHSILYDNALGNLRNYASVILNTTDEINNDALPEDRYTGNIVADPMFRNLHPGDYRLNQSSPALNAGSTNTPVGIDDSRYFDPFGNQRILDWDHDYYGRQRIVGPAVDIGIYEMPPVGVLFFGL